MVQTATPYTPLRNWEDIRDKWVEDVTKLAIDVEKWSEENQWSVKRETKSITEDEIGTYDIPVLTIQTPFGRGYFTPIARFIVGAEGRVEFYATPSFAQVVLIRNHGKWRFFSDDLVDLKKTWSRQAFVSIFRDLLDVP